MADAPRPRSRDRIDLATPPRVTHDAAADRAAALESRFAGVPAPDMLAALLREGLAGRVAVVSSFGAESAVLLHLVATIDAAVPVLFLDTGRHFPETLAYRDTLVARLGLVDLRVIAPDPAALAARDANALRWSYDPDGCCAIRKVAPLGAGLAGFDASITGRKAFQARTRTALARFEADGDRLKINPLADWSRADIDAYFAAHALPPHPLVDRGYPSIGCAPCTSMVQPGEDPRAGRWRGWQKTECGIHKPAGGSDPDLPVF